MEMSVRYKTRNTLHKIVDGDNIQNDNFFSKSFSYQKKKMIRVN
jgi:hypothetical protein